MRLRAQGSRLRYRYGVRRILEESYLPQMTGAHYILLPKGTVVYNAKDTTDDEVYYERRWYGSMIHLWKELTGVPDPDCCNADCPHRNDDIVGGHVVREDASRVLTSGDEVLIVPLCKSCNHCTNDDPIELARDTWAVVLTWDD